jgi:hypothetical protein
LCLLLTRCPVRNRIPRPQAPKRKNPQRACKMTAPALGLLPEPDMKSSLISVQIKSSHVV